MAHYPAPNPLAGDGNADHLGNTTVDVQQFAEFIQQLRAEGAQDRHLMKEESARDRQLVYEELRNRRHQDKALQDRTIATELARRITPCDGSNPRAVRDWLLEVEMSMPYTEQTILVAAQSAQGSLKRQLEHFLNSQYDRDEVSWETLKEHLQTTFLSAHEDDRLRFEVERIKQGAYESTTAFTQRFRELADQAYPPAATFSGAPLARHQDQERILLRAFIRGLRDRHIVERLIKEGEPKTYKEATTLVVKYEAHDYALKLALDEAHFIREEEPMEVGAVATTRESADSVAKKVDNMERQVQGLTQQFTKLMATIKAAATPLSRPRDQQHGQSSHGSDDSRPNRYADNGAPICNFCENVGHMERFCRKKRAAQHRHRQQNNQGGH